MNSAEAYDELRGWLPEATRLVHLARETHARTRHWAITVNARHMPPECLFLGLPVRWQGIEMNAGRRAIVLMTSRGALGYTMPLSSRERGDA